MNNNRKTLDKLRSLVARERIIVLLGSRQVGKTTLMKMLRESLPMTTHYFTMESLDELQLFQAGAAGLRQRGFLKSDEKTCLMIDEFHYLQDPNKLFKEIYDCFPNVTIVASGSSSLEIQQKIKESLAGRKMTLFVYPLDFYEYLQFLRPGDEKFMDDVDPEGTSVASKEIQIKTLEQDFSQFVLYGGLPRVVLEEDPEIKKTLLDEIVSTYLQKDIKGILKNIDIGPFNRLLQLVSFQIGNLLNTTELSKALTLPRSQVSRHLEVLQETFVNFLLKPYSTSKRTEVVKMPKTFFYDNGVRNQMLKQFAPLNLRADGGALLENALFMEIRKNLPVSQDLSYWRTKNQTEVDFVLRRDEHLFPIEVKMGAERNIPPNVASFAGTHMVNAAFILNRSEWFSRKDGGVTYYWIPHFLAGKIPQWIANANDA